MGAAAGAAAALVSRIPEGVAPDAPLIAALRGKGRYQLGRNSHSHARIEFEKALKLSPLYKWVYGTADKDSFVSIERIESRLEQQRRVDHHGADVIVLCARFEMEMIGMSDAEHREFLEMAGASESGLEQLIRRGYHLLGLISYFTTDSRMLRAWTIHAGWTAPQAAGVIHSDLQKGFIRAEVVPYGELLSLGSLSEARSKGKLRLEGKEYEMKDGDVVNFRFNV